MKKYKIIIICLLTFLFGLSAGYCVETFLSANNENSVVQNENVEISNKKKSENKEVNKPALLLFHSQRCSSCTKVRPIWNALKKEYKKEFMFIEIDVDEAKNAPLCMEFLIATIPSIYIEDAPFRNRAYVNPVMYNYLPRFEDELSRYLDLRKILKKGMETED